MWPSMKASQQVGVAAAIDPQSAAAGVINSGWVDMSVWSKVAAVLQAGALGAGGGVSFKFQQAQDNQGTNAKDVTTTTTGAALSQTPTNNSSTQSVLNCKASELDINNGFRFIRLVATVTGANASLVAALVLGVDQHYGLASDQDAATVLQVVN
jgi:hypothetical protein